MQRGFFAFLLALVLALALLSLFAGTHRADLRAREVNARLLSAENRAFARAQLERGTDAVVANTVRAHQPVTPFHEERLVPALGAALFAYYLSEGTDRNAHFSLCTANGTSVLPLVSPDALAERFHVSLPPGAVPHRCPVQVTFAPLLFDAGAKDALVVCAHEGRAQGPPVFLLPRDYTFREEFPCP